MPSLLVTNDFPPKLGGIQSYLYELWRRLPSGDTTVLTIDHDGAPAWDAAQPFRVERLRRPMLLPSRKLARDVDALAREVGARVIFVDPMLPVGLIGPWLRAAPYVVVVHGAEITVPGRLPGTGAIARRVLHGAAGVVAAGGYPAAVAARIARRALPGVIIPPGVDTARFHPMDDDARVAQRARLGVDPTRPMVLGLSRLVPRKGFDVVIDAVAGLPHVQLVIGGAGRDRARLERRAAARRVDVRFLGRVAESDLPAVYACADVFAMCCRERWAGLEAEGFGIVFLEAAAAGVPAVAGRSGGAHEAVLDGASGYVVAPRDVQAVRGRLDTLCSDEALRHAMAERARTRACDDFAYDRLVAPLLDIAGGDLSRFGRLDR